MLLSFHQNIGQNHDIKIANRSFECIAQYLRMTVRNQSLIEEEIKMRLISDGAWVMQMVAMLQVGRSWV
jgi:hypothetical protein